MMNCVNDNFEFVSTKNQIHFSYLLVIVLFGGIISILIIIEADYETTYTTAHNTKDKTIPTFQPHTSTEESFEVVESLVFSVPPLTSTEAEPSLNPKHET